MILNRADLLYYLECDKIALKIPSEKRKPHLLDYIWKYEILLRKAEFYNNIFLRGGEKEKLILYYLSGTDLGSFAWDINFLFQLV